MYDELSENGMRTRVEAESPDGIAVIAGVRLAFFRSAVSEPIKIRVADGESVCILGCIEGELTIPGLENGSVVSSGDVAVITERYLLEGIRAGDEPFRGLMIALSPELLPDRIDCFLTGIQINLEPWLLSAPERKRTRVLRGNRELRQLLTDCSELPGAIRNTFRKLKAIELLLYLGSAAELICDASYLPGFQLEKVRAVKEYLTENIDRRVTLDELAETFNISQSSLKACFKCVYGMPIATFARNCRLERAAALLRKSRHSILEIACMIGYENPGKFAEAFRAVYHVSPRQYRKEKNCLDYFLAVSA